MFESPSKPDGSVDRNAVISLVESLEERVGSIERQKGTAPEASLPSLEAQKDNLEIQIRDLRASLESDIESAG